MVIGYTTVVARGRTLARKHAGKALADQDSPHLPTARLQYAARTAVIAAGRAFGSRPASAPDALKIEATTCHELAKPERRPIAKLALSGAPRPVGFRRVEADEPERLTGNANRVAIDHLDLARLDR